MLGWNLQTICAGPSASPSKQHCQADGFVPTVAQVAAWNPMNIDTDAWARVSASFGAKYMVIVADHMTGFTWWDTKFHNYSIAHTQYKGGGADLVVEMIASCKKYGLKLGFFYSVHFNWFLGVDGFKVGHPPLGPRSYTQAEYSAIAQGQLREIITLFGDEGPLEVWFDGGTGLSAGAIGPTIMDAAPNAVCHSCYSNFTKAGSVRWMGNENGVMPLPSWGPSTSDGSQGARGQPVGGSFMPPSSDTVLREHYWFWKNNTAQRTKSTLQLVHAYLTSVGRAANLILNVAPDATGAVPAADVARYTEMGEAIKCLFSSRVASGGAQNASAADGTIVWSFGEAAAIASRNLSVVLLEDQTDGQLIGKWSLDCQERGSGDWSVCHAHDEGIGHKRIVNMLRDQGSSDITAMRLNVLQHYALPGQTPRMRALEVYDWESKAGCV